LLGLHHAENRPCQLLIAVGRSGATGLHVAWTCEQEQEVAGLAGSTAGPTALYTANE